jgi:hypothetical protein
MLTVIDHNLLVAWIIAFHLAIMCPKVFWDHHEPLLEIMHLCSHLRWYIESLKYQANRNCHHKLSSRLSIHIITRHAAVWTHIKIQICTYESGIAKSTHVVFYKHDIRYFLESSFCLIKEQKFATKVGCHVNLLYGFIVIVTSIRWVDKVPQCLHKMCVWHVECTIGSFKVATYWLLIPLLIHYLSVFYCQSGNK